MDPHSFNINTVSELRLRRHLREVLLPYARTHLTSNHVELTEKVVEEATPPSHTRTCAHGRCDVISPPHRAFEVLMDSLRSLDLALPEERWTAPSESIQYLRAFFTPLAHPQDLPTEKCWNDDGQYTRLSSIYKPICSPILSKRARRETPKLGSSNSRESVPRTYAALAASLNLKSVSVQSIEDPPAPPVDDVLDLRFKLDPATGVLARQFIQSVTVLPAGKSSVDCFDDTPNVYEYMSCHSPPRCIPSLDSPPLFSRVVQESSAHRGVRSSAKDDVSPAIKVSDLSSILQVASPELINGEDDDINGHHMEVVSGWTTLTYSSPPPPSPRSSDRSQVDDLWNISPPGTPATSLVTKMDEVEMPRIRKFGHKNTLINESAHDSNTSDLVAKSPGFFITSFISAPIPMTQTHKPIIPQLEGVKSGMHHPHPLSPCNNTPNSLLVQPPSAVEKPFDEKTLVETVDYVESFEDQRSDDAIASIYIATPQDPLSYITEEKLDDMDIMLIDVPHLPPPTAHPREPALFPEEMQIFVALKREPDTASPQAGNGGFGAMAFLKPVKGIKPLALDLSWRPFNFGKAIPTDEEVAGIVQPIRWDDKALGYCDGKYEKTARALLSLDIPPISAEDVQLTATPSNPRGCEELGTSPVLKRPEESGRIEYLLTQRERARTSGVKTNLQSGVGVQGDVATGHDTTSWSHDDENEHGNNILARDEILCQREKHHGSQNLFDPIEYSSRNRTDPTDYFDDVADHNLSQFSTNGFGAPLLLQPLRDDLPDALDILEANKENVPLGTNDNQPADHRPDLLANQYDWNNYFEFPGSETPSFEPLSFASQSQLLGPPEDLTNPKTQCEAPLTPSRYPVGSVEGDLIPMDGCEQANLRVTKRRKLDHLVPASSKDLFSVFIGLRNQATWDGTLEHSRTGNDMPTPHQMLGTAGKVPPRAAPNDVFDQHTVRLPERWTPAASVHRYLASMPFIQKHALARELQGHQCRAVLVERYDLGGTDIIVDLDHSVLLVSLLALPAYLESTIDRISRESWRYSNLLIVFEAFPSAQSYRTDRSRETTLVPYAYTPPVCKAVKKLRRNLGIAEGCGTMNPRCTITWAFADDVEEAAKFVRCFGEEACAVSMERGHGILWDEREWLEEEEREGEADLARVHGMNAFAAFIMLYDRPLESILDLSPEARLEDFGQLLGQERMMGLNAVIESGMQHIAPDIAESIVS